MYHRHVVQTVDGTSATIGTATAPSAAASSSALTSSSVDCCNDGHHNCNAKLSKKKKSSSVSAALSSSSSPLSLSSSSSPGKTTKRRKGRRYSPWKDLLLHEDTLILLIRGISLLILLVCGLTLLGKWLWSSNGGATRPVNHEAPHHPFNFKQQESTQVGSSSSLSLTFYNFFQWFGLGSVWMNFLGSFRLMGVGLSPPMGSNKKYPQTPMKPSRYYEIPNSMSHIGDKTDSYALLRKEFDSIEFPPIQQQLQFSPLPMESSNSDQVPYDIYNCPEHPPQGYPFDWHLIDILSHWPADDPTPRPQVYQGLCVFDYQKDHDKAMNYREAELPFVIVNDPEVQRAAQRWMSPGYMQRMLGQVKHRAEYSENNHFMYWMMPPSQQKQKRRRQQQQQQQQKPKNNKLRLLEAPEGWKQPTQMLRMTYDEWLQHAKVTDDSLLGPDMPHWYFRLIGCGETGPRGECDAGSSEYLFDELPFFQPKESLYMKEPDQQKGIHCRFGMKGVIAENHFDGARNMIVVLGGERRYILSHPNQCPYLSLLPKGHPSARHSEVDWSNPDLDKFPEFAMAVGNEVVLQAGDVLYLPTNWFHYIISLSLNYQCNTRSGIGQEYMPPIHECGF